LLPSPTVVDAHNDEVYPVDAPFHSRTLLQYSFRITEGWEETPVSIADLGGTEIDVRFKNSAEGDISVVVAPVLRFRDIGNNANVNLEFLGPPDKIIAGFAPELFGAPLNDGDVLDTQVYKKANGTYAFEAGFAC
jgi:hypothetical protein